MAARRSLEEEILKQCKLFFGRENQHWERLLERRIIISAEEVAAKKGIIEAVYSTGAAAAVRMDDGVAPKDLLFHHRELEMTIEAYERAMAL